MTDAASPCRGVQAVSRLVVDRASRQAVPGGGEDARRSALRADCTALLGPGSRRRTRFVRCAHCAQTAAASQMTKRDCVRADPGPALLVAPDIAPAGHRPPRQPPSWLRDETHCRLSEGACGQAAARVGGAEKRRARGRARSALRHLTRRSCLSAVSEANVASSAAGHETEHRREVGAAAPTAEVSRRGLPARAFAARSDRHRDDDRGRCATLPRIPVHRTVRRHHAYPSPLPRRRRRPGLRLHRRRRLRAGGQAAVQDRLHPADDRPVRLDRQADRGRGQALDGAERQHASPAARSSCS